MSDIYRRYETTNSPIRAWNIYESSPFLRKKFLSLCNIVKTTEWNVLINRDYFEPKFEGLSFILIPLWRV